jgi:type 1 glutamine amidotransferase
MKPLLLVLAFFVTPIVATAADPAPVRGPIKVLIVDGFSNHDWQKTTALLKSILGPTGLFQISVSTCPPAVDAPGYGAWRPAFKDYDVVIQTCNDISRAGPAWPKGAQQDFEAFVRDGGGVYIFHSAQNAFANWPAYNEIIGLGWRPVTYGTALRVADDETIVRLPPGEGRATSHGPNGDVVIHQLGNHPIHAGMPRAWKTPHLEVYYDARGPAENVEVLSYGRDPRFGENWPIEWTVRYGQGRVYVATFGHVWRPGRGDNDPESESMRCVGVQTTIVRVVQWLANRPVTWPVPPDFPTATEKSLRPLPKLDLPAAPAPAAPAAAAAPGKA